MTLPLYLFGSAIAAIYALWLFYLAIMNLKRAKDAGTMTRAALVFALPIVLVGWLIDFCVQITLGTVLFLDLPREATLSQRLSRYFEQDAGWRKRVATWLARNLLNTYDPSGQHIH